MKKKKSNIFYHNNTGIMWKFMLIPNIFTRCFIIYVTDILPYKYWKKDKTLYYTKVYFFYKHLKGLAIFFFFSVIKEWYDNVLRSVRGLHL